jgi:hypothetical protein
VWEDLREVLARTKEDFDPTVSEVPVRWEETQGAASAA